MSWSANRYRQGYQSADYTISHSGLQAAKDEHESLEGERAVDEFEVGFRDRIAAEQKDEQPEPEDITRVKAERLVSACNGMGLNAVLHWDRSPWCCRVSLEGTDEITDETASIYFMLEDDDAYKICDGRGWRWHSQIALKHDGSETESDLQDFNLQVLERTWLGDDEHDTARKIAVLVALIDVREIVSA
jgi:hypothetical protein